jgi:hypothetical protein
VCEHVMVPGDWHLVKARLDKSSFGLLCNCKGTLGHLLLTLRLDYLFSSMRCTSSCRFFWYSG